MTALTYGCHPRATLPLSVNEDGTTADEMAVVPSTGEVVVIVPQSPRGDYLVAAKGVGSAWERLGAPCGTWGIDAVAASAGGVLAASCGMGLGMNKEAKTFSVSSDGGMSWQIRSAWRGAGKPDKSGLPISDFAGLAFGPGGAIYMSTTMGAVVSSDGGRDWAPTVTVGRASLLPGNGSPGGQFSFADVTHGWLLWQTVALVRTTDGIHWSVISVVAPS